MAVTILAIYIHEVTDTAAISVILTLLLEIVSNTWVARICLACLDDSQFVIISSTQPDLCCGKSESICVDLVLEWVYFDLTSYQLACIKGMRYGAYCQVKLFWQAVGATAAKECSGRL